MEWRRADADSPSFFDGETAAAVLWSLVIQESVGLAVALFVVVCTFFLVWVARDHRRGRVRFVLLGLPGIVSVAAYAAMVSLGGDSTALASMREMWMMFAVALFYVAAAANLCAFWCVRNRSVPLHLGMIAGGQAMLALVVFMFEHQYGLYVGPMLAASAYLAGAGVFLVLPMWRYSMELDGNTYTDLDAGADEIEMFTARRASADGTPTTPTPLSALADAVEDPENPKQD